MKATNLKRDEQITLSAFFAQGNNETTFGDLRKLTARQLDAFDILVENGFITAKKLGKHGIIYTGVRERIGRPMFELPEVKENEGFSIFK
jgi:hypothetical protein